MRSVKGEKSGHFPHDETDVGGEEQNGDQPQHRLHAEISPPHFGGFLIGFADLGLDVFGLSWEGATLSMLFSMTPRCR